MQYTYYFNNVALDCIIDESEIDHFDPESGHYTKPGDYFVESVSHKGQDITELLADDVLDDIIRAFTEGE